MLKTRFLFLTYFIIATGAYGQTTPVACLPCDSLVQTVTSHTSLAAYNAGVTNLLTDRPHMMLDSFMLALKGREKDSAGFNFESKRLCREDIKGAFADKKISVAYAFILQIQQPKPGTREHIIKLHKVGHTFITLIKYNADGSYTSHSFGFYPVKKKPLSATPFAPETPSVIKEDSRHRWSEAVGKFITKCQFDTILQTLLRFQARRYNLNRNNCTDFGLCAATEAGITIFNTQGKWFGGSGNNPGDAGESVLDGLVINNDTGNTRGLLIKVLPDKKERPRLHGNKYFTYQLLNSLITQ